MSIRPLALAALSLFFLACSSDSRPGSDSRETVITATSCRSCSIVAESIAFLGHEDDTVAIARENLPAMDSRGRFYIGAASGGAVHVFKPDGRLLSSFGKSGRGPGEFARVLEIHAAPHDTILVLAGSAVHIMSPDYTHVRQFPMPESAGDGDWTATILTDGRVLHGAEGGFGMFDAKASVTAGLTLKDLDTLKCEDCDERTFRPATDGASIWSAPQGNYILDHHDLAGNLLQRVKRETDWFIPRTRAPGEQRVEDEVAEFAKPRLLGVRQDSDGILWTHVMLIEDTESLRGLSLDDGNPADMAKILARIVTKVEAIDPKGKKLVAQTTLTNAVFPLRSDYSAQLVPDPSGDWSWRIVKLRVEGR